MIVLLVSGNCGNVVEVAGVVVVDELNKFNTDGLA